MTSMKRIETESNADFNKVVIRPTISLSKITDVVALDYVPGIGPDALENLCSNTEYAELVCGKERINTRK